MSQWGFYFDQSRCVGCKTCMVACKNWNELRRGDVNINELTPANCMVAVGESEKREFFTNEDGRTNYQYFHKFYMKEDLRRVNTFDKGATLLENGVFVTDFDRRYLSLGCNHCENPACLAACPMAAISKDPDTGIVLVRQSACISCGKCRQACPWDVPQYYDENFAQFQQNDPARPRMTKCTMCYDRVREGRKPACVAACWNRALDAAPMDELKVLYPFAVNAIAEFPANTQQKPNILFKAK